MLYMQQPRIIYDKKYDIMNYKIKDTSNSYGDEDTDNIVILKDFDTDEVTGYTILNFGRICRKKTEEYNTLQSLFDVDSAMKKCGIC